MSLSAYQASPSLQSQVISSFELQRAAEREHEDAIVLVGCSHDTRRRECRRGAAPSDPPAVLVQTHCFVGGTERADVVRVRDDSFERSHHPPGDAVPLPVGVHGDAFDIPGSQRLSAMEEATLDHRRVADDGITPPRDGMHPAEAMFPVVLGHLAVERDVEHLAGLRQHDAIDVGGMRDL